MSKQGALRNEGPKRGLSGTRLERGCAQERGSKEGALRNNSQKRGALRNKGPTEGALRNKGPKEVQRDHEIRSSQGPRNSDANRGLGATRPSKRCLRGAKAVMA